MDSTTFRRGDGKDAGRAVGGLGLETARAATDVCNAGVEGFTGARPGLGVRAGTVGVDRLNPRGFGAHAGR